MGAQQMFADLITGSESHVRPWTNFKELCFFFWCILLLFSLGFFEAKFTQSETDHSKVKIRGHLAHSQCWAAAVST